MLRITVLIATIILCAANEDCELHKPAIDDFCCEILTTELEFTDCHMEWLHKIEPEHMAEGEEEHVLHYCTAECTYKSLEYLASKTTLNYEAIKSHLMEEYEDSKMYTNIFKTFEKCGAYANDVLTHDEVKKIEALLVKHDCHIFSGLVMECVANEYILNCPRDKWKDTIQCKHAKEYLEKCL